MNQRVIISHNLATDLALSMSECEHDRIFVLVDETTKQHCWPVISQFIGLRGTTVITIEATDTHKNIDSLMHVWKELDNGMATRHSLLINLGGGMVTDLGGFAASTFKRGINFINIPTTLLAMVDASVGGKTGINFNGLKNEIGVFNDAKFVILDTKFLSTLDEKNLRSGYAEMLKHGMLSDDAHWAKLLNFDLAHPDLMVLQQLLADSVKVKERIVNEDPTEKAYARPSTSDILSATLLRATRCISLILPVRHHCRMATQLPSVSSASSTSPSLRRVSPLTRCSKP